MMVEGVRRASALTSGGVGSVIPELGRTRRTARETKSAPRRRPRALPGTVATVSPPSKHPATHTFLEPSLTKNTTQDLIHRLLIIHAVESR
jgi:hypothetical protein